MLYEQRRSIQIDKDEAVRHFMQPLIEKNPQAYMHSRQVAKYAQMIAGYAGYDTENQILIHTIASVHDIGKADQQYITSLAGKVVETQEDSENFYRHASVGADLLLKEPELFGDELTQMCAFVARYHHITFKTQGLNRLQATRKLVADETIRSQYPAVKDWNKLYDMLMIIRLADAFDSGTNTYPCKIPLRNPGFPKSFTNMITGITAQFESTSEKVEKCRFDDKFYEAMGRFGADMIEFEGLLNNQRPST